MRRPGTRGGTSEKQFSDFSVRAVDAAQARLISHAQLHLFKHVCCCTCEQYRLSLVAACACGTSMPLSCYHF